MKSGTQPIVPALPLLSPGQKARRTARWAITMTKWLITRATRGTAWQVVAFHGPSGAESRGIVDLLVIRKDHRPTIKPLNRGDRFEIILIQVKGGTASWPTADDVQRLRIVAKEYRARTVLLAEWKKGKQPSLFLLKSPSKKRTAESGCWEAIASAHQIFR